MALWSCGCVMLNIALLREFTDWFSWMRYVIVALPCVVSCIFLFMYIRNLFFVKKTEQLSFIDHLSRLWLVVFFISFLLLHARIQYRILFLN